MSRKPYLNKEDVAVEVTRFKRFSKSLTQERLGKSSVGELAEIGSTLNGFDLRYLDSSKKDYQELVILVTDLHFAKFGNQLLQVISDFDSNSLIESFKKIKVLTNELNVFDRSKLSDENKELQKKAIERLHQTTNQLRQKLHSDEQEEEKRLIGKLIHSDRLASGGITMKTDCLREYERLHKRRLLAIEIGLTTLISDDSFDSFAFFGNRSARIEEELFLHWRNKRQIDDDASFR